ncbi:unnamed protein product [Dibothriocephalus latus]|uniref:Uncharacterized protein n=1 Tax=Dibothriocephalus latus TaxID=60516 RepID=A0A3P7QXL7_DIBLA|nr:unnamed protein product [Dibothriocephalus latus]
MLDKAFLVDVASKIYLATDSTLVDMQTYELCCDMIDVVLDISSIYTPNTELRDPPFSEKTAATIVLSSDTVLYLRGINRYMALLYCNVAGGRNKPVGPADSGARINVLCKSWVKTRE